MCVCVCVWCVCGFGDIHPLLCLSVSIFIDEFDKLITDKQENEGGYKGKRKGVQVSSAGAINANRPRPLSINLWRE